MAKLIYTNNTNRYVYECDECHEKTRTYYSERHGKVVCSDCRRVREREKQNQRQDAKIKEAHDKGYADVIDKMLSKIHTTWLFRGNDAKAYREEIEHIAEQLKEQKQIE